MPFSTRFLALVAGAVMALVGASGIALGAGVVAHAAGGIGWDGGSTVSASAAAATQPAGIGWD